jgi:hypothetical protein
MPAAPAWGAAAGASGVYHPSFLDSKEVTYKGRGGMCFVTMRRIFGGGTRGAKRARRGFAQDRLGIWANSTRRQDTGLGAAGSKAAKTVRKRHFREISCGGIELKEKMRYGIVL